MKKLVVAAAAAVGLVFTGCKSVPTVDTMTAVSTAIGYSAGLVANMTKIDDKSREAVVEIVGIVGACVPETNQTFEAAWTPIAQAHVAKLIADGKVSKAQGKMILAAFGVAVMGLDYIFEVRWPEAKQYKELVCAAIDGFSTGFLTVFKPANMVLAANRGKVLEYDIEAFEYLKLRAAK